MKKEMLRGLIFLAIVGVILIGVSQISLTGRAVTTQQTQQVQIVPLSHNESGKVIKFLNSSEMLKDMPRTGVVSLRFFSPVSGAAVWHEDFLIGREGVLKKGKPDIYITLDSKYISGMEGRDLCEVIRQARNKGELGYHTERSKWSLLWKYGGMLKHRDCFGF